MEKESYKHYLNYPLKIKIKEALKIYYGENYEENDYEMFLHLCTFKTPT
jgi:hypothetical protein